MEVFTFSNNELYEHKLWKCVKILNLFSYFATPHLESEGGLVKEGYLNIGLKYLMFGVF